MTQATPLTLVQRAEMSPEARRALHAVAEEAVALLSDMAPSQLWAAAQGLEVLKASPYDEDGRTAGWVPSLILPRVVANGKVLAAALVAKQPVALAASLALLARARPLAALGLFRKALDETVGPGKVLPNEIDVEAALFHTALGNAGAELAKLMAPGEVEDLWARGRLLGDPHVPRAVLAATRWESLRSALRARPEGTSQQIYTVLAERTDVADNQAKLARLTELATTVEKGEEALVGWLADALVEARESAVLPVLQLAEPRMRGLLGGWSAAEIAADLGTSDALNAVAAELPRLAKEIRLRWQVAYPPRALLKPVQANFALDPAHSVDRLAPFFTAEVVSSEAGATLARDILAIGASDPPADLRDRFGGKTMADADPRWLDLVARLVTHRRLGFPARRFLGTRAKPARAAALARAGNPLAGGRGVRGDFTPPAAPGWLDRYVAGAHEEVWAELFRLAKPPKGAAKKEATAVACETMRRVKRNLERIAAVLRKHDNGTSKKAIWPPTAGWEEALSKMASFASAPVPLSLRTFHELVGSVMLGGGRWWLSSLADAQSRAPTWRLDPLVIAAASAALSATKRHRKFETALLPKDLRDPDVGLYLGPSPGSKAPSPWATEDEPAAADDEPFLVFPTSGGVDGIVKQGAEVEIPFVSLLRVALRNGGAVACVEWYVDPLFPPIDAKAVGASQSATTLLSELSADFEPF